MTANELKFSLLLYYDKMFEYGAPAYDDRQISVILNKAQRRVFNRYYMPNRNKFNEGFESSEKRRGDLEQFIRDITLTSADSSDVQIGAHPNGKFYDLPDDFLYALEESVITSDSTPNEITVLPIKHDYYRANINNPYKKPYENLVWRMDFSRTDHGEDGGDDYTGRTSKRVELILKTGSTLSSYRVRYLIQPPDILCDEITPSNQIHCILDESLHDEIVDEAAKIAVAATKPEMYQIFDAEQKNNES